MKSKSIRSYLSIVLIIASALTLLQIAAPVTVLATGAKWWVAPSPTGTGTSGGSCKAPGFNTISAAIAAASAGDTVNVCSGTFVEQVTIGISLTVQSAPKSAPTIQAPATMATDSFGSLNIVTITGSTTTATFSGFTVTGPGSATCGTDNTGLFIQNGATATITKNTIEHIQYSSLSGPCNAEGILVGRVADSTVGHATISSNTVSDYNKAGIVVDNAGSTATITGNTVTGDGPTTLISQMGIQIDNGAVATVDSNTVKNNECNESGCGSNLITQGQAPGIVLSFSGSGSVVNNNHVSGNDVGIIVFRSNAPTVTHNAVSNNRFAGIAFFDGTYTASKNTVSGPGNVGIAAVAEASNTSVTLSSNPISGVTTSIGAFAGSGLIATVLIS